MNFKEFLDLYYEHPRGRTTLPKHLLHFLTEYLPNLI